MEQELLSGLEEAYQGVFTVKVKTVGDFLTINLIEAPDAVRKDKEEVLAKIQEIAPKENCPPIKVYARNNGLQILWFDKLKNDVSTIPPDVADTTIGNDSDTVLQQIPQKEDLFFVIKGTEKTGPFVRIQLESMWNMGQITADCMVESESSQKQCSILEFIKNKKTLVTSVNKLTLLAKKLAQLSWIHSHWLPNLGKLPRLGFVVGITGLIAIISLLSIFRGTPEEVRENPEEVVMRWARGVEDSDEHACDSSIEKSELDPAYLKVVSVEERPFLKAEAAGRLRFLLNALDVKTQVNVENFMNIKYYQVKVEYSEPKNSFARTFSVIRSADFKNISENLFDPFNLKIALMGHTDYYLKKLIDVMLKSGVITDAGATLLNQVITDKGILPSDRLLRLWVYLKLSDFDYGLIFGDSRLSRFIDLFSSSYYSYRDRVPKNSTFCLLGWYPY